MVLKSAFRSGSGTSSSIARGTARATAAAGNLRGAFKKTGRAMGRGAKTTGRAMSRGGKKAVAVLSAGGKKAKDTIKNFGTPKKAADDIVKKGTKNSSGLDAKTLAKSDDVIAASKSQSKSLAKIGIKGALGVGALMILTGNNNPVTAIKETAEGAADIGADLGEGAGGLFQGFGEMFAIIGSHGKYVSSASSCILILMLLSMALSTVKT